MSVFIDVESRKTEETEEFLHTNYAKILRLICLCLFSFRESMWVCALQKKHFLNHNVCLVFQ